MLFRALMDRLIGTNDAFSDEDTYTQSRLSDEAITSLMQVVLQLLATDDDVDQIQAEVVFPALQLLQRVQPPSIMSERIQSSVLKLATSRQWLVRDKAAKTYSALVPGKDRASRIANLVRHQARSQNETHGDLLTARYLLERQGKIFSTEGQSGRNCSFDKSLTK
jgi:BioD-like phosphotransacetylase family protein